VYLKILAPYSRLNIYINQKTRVLISIAVKTSYLVLCRSAYIIFLSFNTITVMDNILRRAYISLTIYGRVVNICAFSLHVNKFSN